MHDELPQQHNNYSFVIAVVTIGMMAMAFVTFLRNASERPQLPPSPQVGQPFPAINVKTWINGKAPSPADLQDHVIVVDAWAHWCGPCQYATPFLIDIHKKFAGQPVTFIGLTSEGRDADSLERSRQYVQALKIPWVNAYAANEILSSLDVHGIPQLWVVDRQNRIVFHEEGWSGATQEIERAISQALQSK